MTHRKAVVVIATSWGSTYGGINSFSTKLCKSLSLIVKDIDICCICLSASRDDVIDAETNGVKLLSLGYEGSEFKDEFSSSIVYLIQKEYPKGVEWWIGHDVITGKVALDCKQLMSGMVANFMHMSYNDYAYVKHDPNDAMSISDKIELQENILKNADFSFGIGPLLYNRLKNMRGKDDTKMIIPGLSDFTPGIGIKDRISCITFGRFEASEFLTKQGPLAVASFANSVKKGIELNSKAWAEAQIYVIGATEEVVLEMRSLANETAGRVINLKALPFIHDQNKLVRLLQDSNLCLMLSWHEGFGLTAWEAISAGIPVIISKNSGVFQLLDSIGGAAIGCIHSVDIKGSPAPLLNPQDIDAVSKLIFVVASDIPRAIDNAQSLRNLLRNKGFNWDYCAESVAKSLKISIVESLLSENISEDNLADFSIGGLQIAEANKILDLANNYYRIGRYNEALSTLDELKTEFPVSKNYEVAIDATLIECEIRVRLSEYSTARALARKIASKTSQQNDWQRYIRAKFSENVLLRDLGEYNSAIMIGEDLVRLSKTIKDDSLLESSYRKLARSQALAGNWKVALSNAEIAFEMSIRNGFSNGDPTSSLAIAEAYRHGLDFENAVKWYTKSRDVATHTGNTDCYLWAVLGLCDSLFLLNSNPKSTLVKVLQFIEDNKNPYRLEKLHVRLSIFAIEMRYENNTNYSEELIQEYLTLGIKWPQEYFDKILKGDYSNPKKF